MRKHVPIVLTLILLFGIILNTDAVTSSVSSALLLCVRAVIPTLFPFFVVSGLLVSLGIGTIMAKILTPLSKTLFNTSSHGAVAFFIGVFCGYPTGAKVIADMFKEGAIDKKEGERLLAFCNNSGPLFVIGSVGQVMLNNHSYGVALYVIHVLSAVATGVILKFLSKESPKTTLPEIVTKPIGKAVAQSVERAVMTTLNVCGYVVFFAVISSLFKNIFITSVLEVTTAVKNLADTVSDTRTLLVLISGVIAFGGVCVMLQVKSAVAETEMSLKLYIVGKIVQSIIAMMLTGFYVGVPVLPIGIMHLIIAGFMVLSGILFLISRLTKKA